MAATPHPRGTMATPHPDRQARTSLTGGLLVRLPVLAAVLAVLAGAVTVIWQRIDPPAPPSSCDVVPADLGAAVGLSGPAPVFYVDEDANALHCVWKVQDVGEQVDVAVYSPGRWSVGAALAEHREEAERTHEIHPAPLLGEDAFSVEEPTFSSLTGTAAARAGVYVVLVAVRDDAPIAYPAEELAVRLAARAAAALKGAA